MAKDAPVIPLPPIQLFAAGATDEVRETNLEMVKPSPGFPDVCFMLVDAIMRRVETVLLDYTREAVAVRYQIDGVWHELPARDRLSSDLMLATLKKLADLDPAERRTRQVGEFGAKYQIKKYSLNLTTQGVRTGERVVLRIGHPIPKLEKFEQTGIRPKLLEKIQALLRNHQGLFLTSTMPGDGRTTLWRCVLHTADRFTRDFFTFEDVDHREPDVINVEAILYSAKSGETPLTKLPQALLRQPDVLCLPDMVNATTVDTFCDLSIGQEKFVIGHVPARNAAEALVRVLAMKADPKKFAKSVSAVLHQRVLRKLCENCRQPFEPPADLLLKLGIRPGRIQTFYDEWRPPPPEQQVDAKGNPIEIPICPQCNGVGYFGRTAIYELLVVDDGVREALLNQPSVQSVAAAAAASQPPHISLKDEGIVLVAKGITSIQELQRVLSK
jgi:type II secretory ATPase GspE/PulE/Tfp pilus assembly ATPase PilB-like protein